MRRCDASHADERREHEEAIKRLRAEYDRLQNRIHAMYVDKLDGKVDGVFFERMSGEWRGEQDRCQRKSNGTRRPTSPTSKKESGFSNWRGTRNGYSKVRNRDKSVVCSIS